MSQPPSLFRHPRPYRSLSLLFAGGVLALGLGAATAQAQTESEFLESLPAEVAEAALAHRLAVGEPIPEIHLTPPGGDGTPVTRATLAGKPSLLVFFAMDNAVRQERSLQILAAAHELQTRYQNRVTLFGVCSDNLGCLQAEKTLRKAGIGLPTLDDEQKNAYTLFGIFMMPAALVVSPEGILLAKIPFSRQSQAEMDGWLRIALGEITPEQLQQEQRPPEEVKRSATEKEYLHQLNLGKIMLQRRIYPKAEEAFLAAIQLMPEQTGARVELGFVQLKMKQWPAAEVTFNTVLEGDPQNLEAVAGLGLALHAQGKDSEALPELQDAAATVKPHPEVLVALAEIYTAQGDKDLALKTYAQAVTRWAADLERCQGNQETPAE